MTFSELRENTMNLFPTESGDKDGHYEWWINQVLQPFENRPWDLSAVWQRILAYDGNTKRPRPSFFYAIANGAPVDDGSTKYYRCRRCGEKLSFSSGGGCVKCRRPSGDLRTSVKPVSVTRCQASCFDCSIYGKRGHVMGPTCDDFGTPRYESCQYKTDCECSRCCRFEYLRSYRPEDLRGMYPDILKTLPAPLSEAGKAFADGRASFVDVNEMLRQMAGRMGKA